MLNSISRVFSITAFVILAKLGYSQYYYDTIPITYDAYVDQGNPNTNYGSDTLGKVGHYTDSTTHYQRFYVNFSLESIPEKARVIGTQINIPYFSQYQTIDSVAVYKVDSLWNEDSITANNQPAISTYDDGSWTWHEASTKTLKLEVWKAVSNYNEGLYHNFAGFVVEMESEIDTNFALIDLYTSEHSDSTKRPYVIVKYFYPTELTNIEVKHESYAGAGDGAISFTTTKGVSPFTYQWVDATGTVISTDSILDSLSAGWYGVYIDAAVGGWTQDEFYKEFLVGVECDTVSISVALDATYSIAAIVGNGSGWPDRNQPNGWAFLAARTNQVNSRTYYKAPIYVDPAFNVQSVDFEMHGLNHIGTNYHINKAQLMMVTEDWWERGVTYNNQPTFDTTNWVLVDSTHYLTQNRTVDLTDYWQYWQKYDSLNFGMLFKIIDENYQYNLRQQHYTANAVDSLRPTFNFVLDLTTINAPYPCDTSDISYVTLKNKLDGGFMYAFNGNLKISFHERNPIDTSRFVPMRIYDKQHNLLEEVFLNGSTLNGYVTPQVYKTGANNMNIDLTGIPGMVGDDYYIIEVVTIEGKNQYQRFLYKN